MIIHFRAHTDPVSQALRSLYRDQIPFATSKAINATLVDGQRAQRQHMRRAFTLRRPGFADRSIKIRGGDWATKRRLKGIIRVETPGGGARNDVFTQHEPGGDKHPLSGTRLAVPQGGLRVGVIPRNKRPKSYLFERMGGKQATARFVYRGRGRTWMIRNPDGSGGIYQRVGAKATKRRPGAGRRLVSDRDTRKTRDMHVRVLFLFTPLARLERRLAFVDTVTRTARKEYPKRFQEEFHKAIQTAR